MTRHNFSSTTKRAARARSGGVCECRRLADAGVPGFSAQGCGRPLGAGNTFYEHIDPDAISARNDLDNCAVLSKTCWRLKTASYDLPIIARTARRRDRNDGIKAEHSRPLAGTRRSGIKLPLGFRARPIDRSTGQPWQPRR